MSGVLIAAACLVFIDRLLFRGQLLSLFIQGCREYLLCPKKESPPEVHPTPSPPPDPGTLIVRKYYADGLERSGAAKTEIEVEKAPKRNIFALPPPQDALHRWEDPDFAFQENIPKDPDEHSPKTVRVDPEVRRKMEELTDGDPPMPEDYTDEERQAVANFNSGAFT